VLSRFVYRQRVSPRWSMTYIVNRRDRFYVVAYDGIDPISGKERRRWHPAGASRDDAEDLSRQLERDLSSRSTLPPGRGTTLGRFLVEDWLPRKRRMLAPTTAYRYAWMIDHYVIPRLGHVHLRRLRADHFDDVYTELFRSGGRDGDGLSPKTVLEVHVLVRGALDDARAGAVWWSTTSSPTPPGRAGGPTASCRSDGGPVSNSPSSSPTPGTRACTRRCTWPRARGCGAARSWVCTRPCIPPPSVCRCAETCSSSERQWWRRRARPGPIGAASTWTARRSRCSRSGAISRPRLAVQSGLTTRCSRRYRDDGSTPTSCRRRSRASYLAAACNAQIIHDRDREP
jgi:hypothetical protein